MENGKTGLGTGVASRNITSGVMERAVFRQANRTVALVEKTFPDGLPGRLDSFHVCHGEASTETTLTVVKGARVNERGKILGVTADSASCRIDRNSGSKITAKCERGKVRQAIRQSVIQSGNT